MKRHWLACVALAGLGAACSDASSESRSSGAAGAAGMSSGGATTVGVSGSASGGLPAGTSSNAGSPSGGAASTSGSGGAEAGGSGGKLTAGTGGQPSSGGAGEGGGANAAHAFKGVANAACADLAQGRLNASWWYNWTLSPGSCKTGEFVPMISGKNEKTPEAVTSALKSLKAAGYRTVLGFNEPNKTDQSNLSVAEVVKLWPAITADLEVRVGSPATSADAKAWFEDFMSQADAQSLRVDFVAVHWYGWNTGSCNDAKELEGYLTWAEKFKRPIWITEFGCMNQSNPSAEVVQSFYAAVVGMLERHPSVERYAWYPWNSNNELVLNGNLTPLGTAFGQAAAVR